ncbi:MAG: prepilin-type N-terminal cleavage/methylation domain-containing protein [Chthoniobacterales bacterium]
MKLNQSVSSSRRTGGMTLVELMIAVGIVGFVLLICYSSSIGLQRGFGYSSAWTEARVNQVRVLDSLALDLRNATQIQFSPPALITLTIPDRYSSYYRNSGGWGTAETFNAAAGDPTQAASPIPAPTPNQFGKIAYSNTISVAYAFSPDGTKILRKVVWTGGPAGGASRDIATFPNGSTVTFTPNSPTTITNASNITSMTARIQTSPDYLRPNNPAVLENTVFLRELSIK